MPNQLIQEHSPYLLQHADNPVNWYPWGDEAFIKANEEQKPVIVSIGYSACHWCHVMAHESFEDQATADFMNAHFVCVKVDREEHPDVDQLYMDAVQAISGSGGWPLNVFVTPDRIPFFGGTYYPPSEAFNRPSWMQVLGRMHSLWETKKDDVEKQSEQMLQYLRQTAKAAVAAPERLNPEDCTRMRQQLLTMADKEWGGFGNAPKFPGTMAITFLLENSFYSKDAAALDHALLSLDRMIAGGIYDQIGGGFSRYSTDRQWLAPHFEKMLYDNALLISTLSDAFKYSGKKRYKEVVAETITFINRELRDSDGGFFSALDADSEGAEGKYYTWSWQEWLAATNGGDPVAEAYFGIIKDGNWEGVNILHEAMPVGKLAAKYSLNIEECKKRITAVKNLLLRERNARIRPSLDDKLLLSWNALMNAALAKAAVILDVPEWLVDASRHMEWMEKSFGNPDGSYSHITKSGQGRISAKLDDYAYLMHAMINLGMMSGDHEWIIKSDRLCKHVLSRFAVTGSPFFYYTADDQNDLPVRKVDIYDGVTPSSNAVMAQVLSALGLIMEHSGYNSRALEMLSAMSGNALRYTYSFGHWATLLQQYFAVPKTFVTTGDLAEQYRRQLMHDAGPESLIMHASGNVEKIPLTADKKSDGDSLIFVCAGTHCYPPVDTPENALQLR